MDSDDQHTAFDVIGCPECHAPAEITDRFDLPGTDGPVGHVRTRCVDRHLFTLLTERLPAATVPQPARRITPHS